MTAEAVFVRRKLTRGHIGSNAVNSAHPPAKKQIYSQGKIPYQSKPWYRVLYTRLYVVYTALVHSTIPASEAKVKHPMNYDHNVDEIPDLRRYFKHHRPCS